MAGTAVVEREALPDGEKIVGVRGVMILRRPARHVELVSGRGHAEAAFADAILTMRQTILAECGKIAIFDDLEDATGYDSEVRVKLTEWARRNKSRIVAFHILTRSKLVAMGVSVANLALGGHIKAHLQRAAFEAALEKEIKG